MEGGHIYMSATPRPDVSKYRVHLAHMGLPPEREDEIILSIQRIMTSFVDRAWNDDPVQQLRLKTPPSASDAFRSGAVSREGENDD